MLTNEIFWKMDLECVYSNGFISDIKKGYYVYLIKNEDKYYVGLSERLDMRIKDHIRNNTNNVCDDNSQVYILENVENKYQMKNMEYIWIIWFCLNTDCINVMKGSYKIRSGKINNKHISRATNYFIFCDYEYINGVRLLDSQYVNNIMNEVDYFGRNI
jgi:hypothetical protein